MAFMLPALLPTLGQVAAARRSVMTATNNTISDDTEDLFDNLNELAASVESHTDALTIIRKRSDVARAKRENKVGIIQGFQQTSCFENGPERIDAFRKHGVRIMQITYNKRNVLRDGCLEPANAGLTNAGIAAVRRTTWVSG